ncbi:hypothetical protein [Paraburkholderia sp. BL6669N2]|uniref:hypothetical protein n=1 Tax=Paraburkholderia sp. BL6669N2 TaxID=1938807 RepID=UPI0011C04B35|nr:hypothetical protein [Paraburkholderia sp. BL6669N2]
MTHNCGFEHLRDLLTTNIGGEIALRSSLAPVAAWLVADRPEPWRRMLEDLILATAPEIHLLYGDPGGLSVTFDAGGVVHSGEQTNGVNQADFDGFDASTDDVCFHIGSRVSYGTCRNAVLAMNLMMGQRTPARMPAPICHPRHREWRPVEFQWLT